MSDDLTKYLREAADNSHLPLDKEKLLAAAVLIEKQEKLIQELLRDLWDSSWPTMRKHDTFDWPTMRKHDTFEEYSDAVMKEER